jgi:copper binding plastocyanin/azurin family protein
MTFDRRGRCCLFFVLVSVVVLGSRPVVAETHEVTLDGFSFWYEGAQNLDIELDIQVGDTVRWLWVDGFHNVSSGFPEDGGGGELFLSGAPTSVVGTTFEYTFNDPGVFGYHCHPHEPVGMISFVTVSGGATQAVPTSSWWGVTAMVLCVLTAGTLGLRHSWKSRSFAATKVNSRL